MDCGLPFDFPSKPTFSRVGKEEKSVGGSVRANKFSGSAGGSVQTSHSGLTPTCPLQEKLFPKSGCEGKIGRGLRLCQARQTFTLASPTLLGGLLDIYIYI